jgi:hypothetical protein
VSNAATNSSLASPKTFLNYARQYFQSSEILAENGPNLTQVRYSLYFHTTELLLKAYLRAKGETNCWGHEISNLHEKCRHLGLGIKSDGEYDLQNIVGFLESGNEDMGFRYFSRKSGPIPDLVWTRDVVRELLTVVSAFVESTDKTPPGVDTKAVLMFCKPQPEQAATATPDSDICFHASAPVKLGPFAGCFAAVVPQGLGSGELFTEISSYACASKPKTLGQILQRRTGSGSHR